MSMIRCKFRCTSVTPRPDTDLPTSVVVLSAIHSPEIPEDEAFTKFTPWGEMKVAISNPRALETLKAGSVYYLDITPAG